MIETHFCGFLLRFMQSLVSASPFILAGLLVAGVFRRLMGREMTVRLFGGDTRRGLFRAWLLGMLLPVCSLGVIPVIREMRRMGLKGGTILAFAMSAPLFNPLSILYGLTLSEPIAIYAFALCSLVIVTVVGLIWDRLFPDSDSLVPQPPEVSQGFKRMLSLFVAIGREAGGASLLYILIGLFGVAMLSVILPHGGLQHAMNGDNPFAPLVMMLVAIPIYATPMLAMSQLGMMFQHANSPGAAFVLLVLGAGMNLGLLAWILTQYGLKRTTVWFGLVLVVVLVLAYSVDRPLFPHSVDPADHTHAFDIYCSPYPGPTSNVVQLTIDKYFRDTKLYERYAGLLLMGVSLFGLAINLLDRKKKIEAWLEKKSASMIDRIDVVIPNHVLGGLSILGLIVLSIIGCYAYYPPPSEVLDEMNIAKAEALGAALTGDKVHAKYWIEIYDDWSRKLEVGTFLRDWRLSDYHRIKARILREQLELLEHELEEDERTEVRRMVSHIALTQIRLRTAYMEER